MTIEQLTEEFESCRRSLKSYILRMTASMADTEDLLQDTFLKLSKGFPVSGGIHP
jgi:DNA-directed RNA polymerase specialized sigma24 family protein